MIGTCLEAMPRGLPPRGELEIVVVANGCRESHPRPRPGPWIPPCMSWSSNTARSRRPLKHRRPGRHDVSPASTSMPTCRSASTRSARSSPRWAAGDAPGPPPPPACSSTLPVGRGRVRAVLRHVVEAALRPPMAHIGSGVYAVSEAGGGARFRPLSPTSSPTTCSSTVSSIPANASRSGDAGVRRSCAVHAWRGPVAYQGTRGAAGGTSSTVRSTRGRAQHAEGANRRRGAGRGAALVPRPAGLAPRRSRWYTAVYVTAQTDAAGGSSGSAISGTGIATDSAAPTSRPRVERS